jgi:hypothetical protein
MYNLKMSKEQASVMRNALEIYSRLRAGQINIALKDTFPEKFYSQDYPDFNHETLEFMYEYIRAMVFPELSYNASYGVGHDVTGDIAWDLQQVIRHKLAWDRLKEEGKTQPDHYGVQYNEPMKFGTERLAEINDV